MALFRVSVAKESLELETGDGDGDGDGDDHWKQGGHFDVIGETILGRRVWYPYSAS
jgi:hypothetical protein